MAPALSKGSGSPTQPCTAWVAAPLTAEAFRPALDRLLEILEGSVDSGEALLNRLGKELDNTFRRATNLLTSCCSAFDVTRYLWTSDAPPLEGTMPVIIVLHIIAMLYSAFVFVYMPAAGIALDSPTSLIFHSIIFLVLASYARAAQSDPGAVPDTGAWRKECCPPPQLTEKKVTNGKARWCKKCGAHKPDRAHHCSALGRCVLRMDHYCMWIGNAVGFGNHKYFMLFLLYVNAACSMLGISILQLLVQATLPPLTTFLLIGAEGLTLLLSSILVPFLTFHCGLLAKNMTTIELCERLGDGKVESNAYDVGIYANVCSIMGHNPLLWLLPIGGPSADGLGFPTSEAAAAAVKVGEASRAGSGERVEAQRVQEEEAEHEEAAEEGRSDGPDRSEDHDGDGEEEDTSFAVWMSGASEFVRHVAVGCQCLGDSLRDSLEHIQSICEGDGRNKRALLRRSSATAVPAVAPLAPAVRSVVCQAHRSSRVSPKAVVAARRSEPIVKHRRVVLVRSGATANVADTSTAATCSSHNRGSDSERLSTGPETV